MPSFTGAFDIDDRVSLKLEYELAVRLGEFILKAGTEDKQLVALGHKLYNLEEDDNPKNRTSYRREENVIRSTGRLLSKAKDWQGWEENRSNENWHEQIPEKYSR
jgi:hypothetical protein